MHIALIHVSFSTSLPFSPLQSPEKKGKEANMGLGGPVVSSLYHEEIIREENKDIFDYCRENNIDHITKVIKTKNMDVNMKDEEV